MTLTLMYLNSNPFYKTVIRPHIAQTAQRRTAETSFTNASVERIWADGAGR